jgi:hypothetical protein
MDERRGRGNPSRHGGIAMRDAVIQKRQGLYIYLYVMYDPLPPKPVLKITFFRL